MQSLNQFMIHEISKNDVAHHMRHARVLRSQAMSGFFKKAKSSLVKAVQDLFSTAPKQAEA